MNILISLLAFFVLIGIVITIHEGGHFLVGRWCGIKMLEFSIGFGRPLYEKQIGKEKTKFSLRLIPLGGYVKPLDESALSKEEWEALSPEDKAKSFSASARWKKFLMVLAGPLANFILAFFLYIFASLFIGLHVTPPEVADIVPGSQIAKTDIKEGDRIIEISGTTVQSLSEAYPYFVDALIDKEKIIFKTDKNKSYTLDFENADLMGIENGDLGKYIGFYFSGSQGQIKIEEIGENSIAQKAGLKIGDIVKSINGTEVLDVGKMIRIIRKNVDKEISIVVLRNDKESKFTMVPKAEKVGNEMVGRIGGTFSVIKVSNEKILKYGFIESITKSYQKITSSIYTTIISIKRLIVGELSIKSISGPISIADYSGKSAQKGLYYYLIMMASISIAIGVFNLLPIPTLDGGHLTQYIVEYTIGRDLPTKIVQNIQYVGIMIMVSLMSFSLINDILKYI